jgi:lipoate-protein ligase B
MQQAVYVKDLGNMEYGDAWSVQDALLLENTNKKIKLAKGEDAGETIHHLLFCEHPPVYTLGKSGKEEHVLRNWPNGTLAITRPTGGETSLFMVQVRWLDIRSLILRNSLPILAGT